MSQISRPIQIALLALGVLVAVWFVALRGQNSSSGGSGSPSSSSSAQRKPAAPSAAAEAKSAAAPTPVYHGAAPGVEGLTRAIAKAHEAVANSQQQAKQVEQESAQSGPSSTAGAPVAPTTGNQPKAAPATQAGRATTGAPTASAKVGPSMQATVEAELRQGKVVTILFWNPKSSVDRTVYGELGTVAHALGGKVAVHNARAAQVGAYGSITRAVPIDVTPTILIVNPRGQTSTMTGLTDAFAIEQAIDEARRY